MAVLRWKPTLRHQRESACVAHWIPIECRKQGALAHKQCLSLPLMATATHRAPPPKHTRTHDNRPLNAGEILWPTNFIPAPSACECIVRNLMAASLIERHKMYSAVCSAPFIYAKECCWRDGRRRVRRCKIDSEAEHA